MVRLRFLLPDDLRRLIGTRIGPPMADRYALRGDSTCSLGLSSGAAASPEPGTSGLLRGISRPLLVALLVNSIIGAGILGLPGRAYTLAGSWSLLAWVCRMASALPGLTITWTSEGPIVSLTSTP